LKIYFAGHTAFGRNQEVSLTEVEKEIVKEETIFELGVRSRLESFYYTGSIQIIIEAIKRFERKSNGRS